MGGTSGDATHYLQEVGKSMILKPEFYDRFSCIADECSYSCCMDWDINLDVSETERIANADGTRNERPLIISADGTSKLDFGKDGKCQFLTDQGFCRLVLEHGEDFIGSTCHLFPRFDSYYMNVQEKHLSNACPAVLDFFLRMPSPMTFVAEDEEPEKAYADIDEDVLALRERCIDLLQVSEWPLWIRLYLLKKIISQYGVTNNAKSAIGLLTNPEYLLDNYEDLRVLSCDPRQTISMVGTVVKEIGFYKKDLRAYRLFLQPLEESLNRLQNPDDELVDKWRAFCTVFHGYEVFFEHVCVNSLFTHLESEVGPKNFDLSISVMLLEYIMIRGVLFISNLKNDVITDADVKNITAYFARMFEHGIGGTEAFLKANLDNPWFSEAGYLTMMI